MKQESIDYWLFHMSTSKDFSSEVYESLQKEFPLFISWVGDRACNLQCSHCIFQPEKRHGASFDTQALVRVVSQIQQRQQAVVIHEGRILQEWQIPILTNLQRLGARVGLIDNGTYQKLIPSFEQKLDWLDISIDGTEGVHNKQRGDSSAYQIARTGIEQARTIAQKVTALFTLTATNYHDLLPACTAVIDSVDEFHITPMSPARPEIQRLGTTTNEFAVAWKQLATLQSRYPEKVFVRMYHDEDLAKLKHWSKKEFVHTMKAPVALGQGRVVFQHNGVTFSYLPKSLSINETIVCDVDMWYRLPYSIAYTIAELAKGQSRFGENITAYSIDLLTKETCIETLYQKAIKIWWDNFGKQSLQREKSLFLY